MNYSKEDLERSGDFSTPVGFFWRVRKEFLLENYYELELRRYRKHMGSTLVAHKTYASSRDLPEACKDLLTRYLAEEKAEKNLPVYGDYK